MNEMASCKERHISYLSCKVKQDKLVQFQLFPFFKYVDSCVEILGKLSKQLYGKKKQIKINFNDL